MLNNVFKKISTRLLLSYSVPLICLATLGVSAYGSAQDTFVLERQREYLSQSNHAANDASYHLIDSIRQVKGYLLNPNDTRYIGMYSDSHDQFLAQLATLTELSKIQRDDELDRVTESLSLEGSRINRAVQRIFAALAENDVALAKQRLVELEADNVELRRQGLLTYLDDQSELNSAEFERAQQKLNYTLLWGTVLATLLTLGLAVLLTRQIRQQMNKMVGVVEQNGIQVTTSSTQIAASSRQLEASVSEQVASTTEITATAIEIAATAEELTQTMHQVVDLSESTAETASAGKADLEKMATTIQQLIMSTATISAKLGMIDDKANNISAVVTAITKVADQTNLLSLNAAIEAEKAGEYGAGFSVVAREIRRLADQTAIATLDIENMVKEMLSSVSAGVMEMDKFSQDVGENADSISQISLQMGHIISQVQSLVPQFETVSNGMLAQAQGAQQIRAAMEQLNDTSQQTAESVKDTNQVILQLSDVAQDLQSEVGHFRLAL